MKVMKVNALWAKGYFTYRLPDQNRPAQTRILIGAYATRDGAEWFSEQLTKDGFDPRVLSR